MSNEADAEAHDAEELARLVRFMTRPGRRFGLALARYHDASVAAELRKQACARAGVRTAAVVARAGAQLLEQLVEAGREHDVLFVMGLDEIAYDASERGPITRAVVDLNFRRDELPERLDVRVVFWISTEAYGQLARLAWDLLDVMLLRFEFLAERAHEPEQSELPPPTRPAWMMLADDVNVAEFGKQAASFAALARTVTDEFTKADAAASAGQLFASIGRLDDAQRWLGEAAATYEQLGRGQGDAQDTLSAATQLRRAAEVAQLRGDAEMARGLAERAAELAGTMTHQREAAAREHVASLGVLASMSEEPPDVRGSDDWTLFDRWRAGDRRAGSQLVRRYFNAIRVYFSTRDGSRDAEELVQDTFFRTLHQAAQRMLSFRAALFGVARDVWLESVRRRVGRGESQTSFEKLLPHGTEFVDVSADDALAVVRQREHERHLIDALATMPLADSELLELYYWHELSVDELAEVFNVAKATIVSRLRRAREQLRRVFTQLAAERHEQPIDEAALMRELEDLRAKLRRVS